MLKRLCACICLATFALSARAFTLPYINTSGPVKLNEWTSQVSAGFAAARAYNRPMLIGFVNHYSNGGGCSHCATWINTCIYNGKFSSFLNNHSMVLVMVNLQTDGNFYTYYSRYIGGNGSYPGIAIYNPNGTCANSLNQNNTLWKVTYTKIDNFISWLSKYVGESSSSKLYLASATGSVSEGATYTGTVTREGTANAVTATLTASKGTVSPASFTWNNGQEGNQTFTYTPVTSAGYTPAYTVTLTLSTSSTTEKGTMAETITVKDALVKQTLDEFKAADTNFASLASNGADWFVDQTNLLRSAEVAANGTTTLSWTAPKGGKLAFTSSISQGSGTFTVSLNGAPAVDASTIQTIGVSSNDTVVFTGTSAAADTVFALNNFAFSAYAPVTITAPREGANIQVDYITNDVSIVDITWAALASASSYTLCYGAKADALTNSIDVGAALATNGVLSGIISTNTAQGDVYLRVDATVPTNAFSLGSATVMGTVLHFSVIDRPIFKDDVLKSGTVYTKAGTVIDVSASSSKPITYSASGLPSGMSIGGDGYITGTPKKEGTYTVTVTAQTSDGATTTTFTLTVAKVTALKEKCFGLIFKNQTELVGTVELNIYTSGKYRAKIYSPGLGHASGTISSDALGNLYADNGLGFSLVRNSSGLWHGLFGGNSVVARQYASSAPFAGYFTGTLSGTDNVRGYLTYTLRSTGKLSIKGYLPDKRSASISTKAIALSQADAATAGIAYPSSNPGAACYFPFFKTGSGAVCSMGCIAGDTVSLEDFAWAGKFSATLSGSGARYYADFSSLNGKTLVFAGGGVTAAEIPLSVSGTTITLGANSVSAKLKVKAATGIYSGSFRYNGRGISMKGVIVPAAADEAGIGRLGLSTYFYSYLK